MKDNLRFGLRQREKTEKSEKAAEIAEKDYNLVSYKIVGDSELFLNFENGTKYCID
jgi:hypothetical protein